MTSVRHISVKHAIAMQKCCGTSARHENEIIFESDRSGILPKFLNVLLHAHMLVFGADIPHFQAMPFPCLYTFSRFVSGESDAPHASSTGSAGPEWWIRVAHNQVGGIATKSQPLCQLLSCCHYR